MSEVIEQLVDPIQSAVDELLVLGKKLILPSSRSS